MSILLYLAAIGLCLTGLLLSSLGFSGTWLVLLAALLTTVFSGFPGPGTLAAFTAACILTEIIEMLAGYYGVTARGGSKAAGFAALAGGLIGAALGSALFPVAGTLFGMLAGSFAAAFAVEWRRLRHHGRAAGIASGAVIARLGVLLLKTFITLIMIIRLTVTAFHATP